MRTVFKYPIINKYSSPYCKLPINAEVISAVFKNIDDVFIYAIVDPLEEQEEKREIVWLGTGWGFKEDTYEKIKKYQFLGTFNPPETGLYWHIWIENKEQEEKEKEEK